MGAFGQAGFSAGHGSNRRQRALQSQGKMDPYGNQVRQAMRAPGGQGGGFQAYSQPMGASGGQQAGGGRAYAPPQAAPGQAAPRGQVAANAPRPPVSDDRLYSIANPGFQSNADAAVTQGNRAAVEEIKRRAAGGDQRALQWTQQFDPLLNDKLMFAQRGGEAGAQSREQMVRDMYAGLPEFERGRQMQAAQRMDLEASRVTAGGQSVAFGENRWSDDTLDWHRRNAAQLGEQRAGQQRVWDANRNTMDQWVAEQSALEARRRAASGRG
jgi:hypothetical protein